MTREPLDHSARQSVNAGNEGEGLSERDIQLGLLVDVNTALAKTVDEEAVLGRILALLIQRTQLTHASIFLLDPDGHQLRCVAESGFPPDALGRVVVVEGSDLAARVVRTAEAVYQPNGTRDPGLQVGGTSLQSKYAAPLLIGSNVKGVLEVESGGSDSISPVIRKLVDQFVAQIEFALERARLYAQLRASEEGFRSIFEQGQMGIVFCGLKGDLTAVNPFFAHLLGYEPSEMCGKHFNEITYPDDQHESAEVVRRLLEGQASEFTKERRYLHKSGQTIWCSVTVSLVRDSSGKPAYFLATIQDIQEGKKAEAERACLEEQIYQAQKMEEIGTLAAGIAHDFNNLLNVMLGFASLVRLRLGPEDPLQEPIQMIEQSAERAADLTRQLLGLARQGKRQAKPLHVQEVLDRVAKIVAQTFDPCIQVHTQWAQNLPLVKADPSSFEQAILNLCINARDAMPKGGTLILETAMASIDPQDTLHPPECPPGHYIRVAVRDTGIGIKREVLHRIFEPFFTTKAVGKGTGLGLAMVASFVKSSGGFVRVESEVGQGTQFTIHLPALQAAEVPAQNEEPQRVQKGSGTVLVVDDEPLILAFAQEGLKKLGYEVLTAENGRRALEIYAPRAGKISCVLLDIIMPEISGWETCRKLREIDPRARVILSSGYSTGSLLPDVQEAGASDFIGKPYTLETLSQTLHKNTQG